MLMEMLKNMCPSINSGVHTSILATTEVLLSNRLLNSAVHLTDVSIGVSVYQYQSTEHENMFQMAQ